ncbi:hypothetical protein OUZ56_009037 [Daphnia magna]|uniref:Uncharacterized protein n=1 Tax=Daphnia magna TaxID=35525 RepID=A0ABR0AEU2_9CRUS|nr:hypothetical protein OUZ56_009037 [Daphnia magna]
MASAFTLYGDVMQELRKKIDTGRSQGYNYQVKDSVAIFGTRGVTHSTKNTLHTRRLARRKKERGKILWCVAESRDIQVTGYGRLDERMSGGAAHEPMRENRRGARDEPTQDRNSAIDSDRSYYMEDEPRRQREHSNKK